MRILQVVTDTDRRGAQVFATDLAVALEQLGQPVHTVALTAGSGLPALDVEVLGARSRGFRTLRALRIAMAKADITIAHGSSTLLACGLAGLGPGRPFVYRQISDSRFWAPTRWRRLRVTAYLRLPKRIVALSDSAASTLVEYLHVRTGRVDVVPNGVPRRDFFLADSAAKESQRHALGLPLDAFLVLYIGALVPEKGTHIAIEALATVDAHLVVVGDGPERERLQDLAAISAPGRVHFLGTLADVLPAYQSCDVVVLPSLGGDSMPATLIEAGFCALPSISTPIGSIGEIVQHGLTGLLTDPGDVQGTASAFELLRTDVQQRSALGAAAETYCTDRFEIGVVASAWAASLDRTLAN